jgi:hypothetical protein
MTEERNKTEQAFDNWYFQTYMEYNNQRLPVGTVLLYGNDEAKLTVLEMAFNAGVNTGLDKVFTSSLREEVKSTQTTTKELEQRNNKQPFHDMFGPEDYTYKIEASEQKDSPNPTDKNFSQKAWDESWKHKFPKQNK